MQLLENEVLILILGFTLGAIFVWFILKQKHNLELKSLTNESNIKITNMHEKLQSEKNHFEEKLKLLDDSKQQLKIEFENLSNKLYEQNIKKSNNNLSLVLTPFKDQIQAFGSRVNEIYNDETKQRSSLLGEIKYLKELNSKISQDAINLTNALKGENKTQGDWGEMILSKILEQSGLKEGREFSTQSSYTSLEGKRLRPDVVLHLPKDKDIVIDSKVSLVSYVNYNESKNKEEREKSLKDLMTSLKSHIKDLSSKEYEHITEVKTLDFVLMFIPIEGALMLAASNDSNIFKTAFDNNIMLVSSSTLFVTLRTIENIWRYEYQNENAQIISKKAADLYDKFAGFVEDLEEVGKNIGKTQKAYESSFNKLSTGKGNLLTRVSEFKDLGVKPKKELP